MSLRHGLGHPNVACKCDYNFTCGYCLNGYVEPNPLPPPWQYPSDKLLAEMDREASLPTREVPS